jgi:hypothetical protein
MITRHFPRVSIIPLMVLPLMSAIPDFMEASISSPPSILVWYRKKKIAGNILDQPQSESSPKEK